MRERAFGPDQRSLPLIGIGTWNMERDDRSAAIRAIRRAIELGMTHVDTAEMYGSGEVERIVGEAIDGIRDRAFLATKVLPSNASYEGTIRACEASLRRLRTDRVDLYLLHWPSDHPLEETIRAFERLTTDGKIARFGVSNFDVEDMKRALAIAGQGRIACNQVLYHLEEREIEWRLHPWCAEHGIAIVAYSPFGQTKHPWTVAASRKVLEEIGVAHEVSAHAVALAFLVARDGVFAIPKSSSIAHLEANAAVGDLVLTQEELARIDAAFPRARERRELPML